MKAGEIMKLSLQKIQTLDFILQRLNSKFSYTSENQQLNLIIKIDNSLWKGNFAIYDDYKVNIPYIDYDNSIENDSFSFPKFFRFENYNHFSQIKLDNLDLLMSELLGNLDKIQITEYIYKLEPMLYNAVNLDTNLSLPFLLLDPNLEYEVVSINVYNRS